MIDILLPFYGDPALLREAVASVLAQRSDDWNLYVVDDASPTTGMEEWIAGLDQPRVTYVRNPERLGVRDNFQRCLRLGSSPYAVLMGYDDVMEPWYVDHVLALFTASPAVAAVQPRVTVIDETGRAYRPLVDAVKRVIDPVAHECVVLRGESLLARLMVGNWLYFPAIAWRRAAIAKHPFRRLDTALDLGLLADLALCGESVLLSPEPAFRYRRHASSASSATARSAERFGEEQLLSREIAARCASRGWRRAARMARFRPTSRLHAGHLAARSLGQRNGRTGATLMRYALG